MNNLFNSKVDIVEDLQLLCMLFFHLVAFCWFLCELCHLLCSNWIRFHLHDQTNHIYTNAITVSSGEC